MSGVSVIIPTWNERESIGALVDFVKSNAGDHLAEIIVADAGSPDETGVLAQSRGATVLQCAKGRSVQMNRGAEQATGGILYFLHADSKPPRNFTNYIVDSVEKGNVAGCFRMRFDSRHWLLRLSAWFTRFNNRLCRGGDQSMFIRRDIFMEIGKFDEKLIIFEDNEILNRIRARGKFDVIQHDIVTSARRFRENGTVRLYLIFMWMHTKYRLGVPHDKLLSYYKRHVR